MTHASAKHPGNGEHVKDDTGAVKDAVNDLTGEVGRFARHRVSDVRDSAAAAIDTVSSKVDECNDSVVGFIRKNPYKSLAIAAGIGFAASILLRRR